ncbi:hypothetical protein [Fulvivirga lutea]|uniref:Uncharacterized protein n=1 Tax=Fulvivirga lutea TaxID=2810512 RepID=A0A974WK43_9BACT|nr:hypothetical protein [Fulvivirga lutea]QSE98677.1 hypothetical protein JR347_06245 [Fulvivirga lutea]
MEKSFRNRKSKMVGIAVPEINFIIIFSIKKFNLNLKMIKAIRIIICISITFNSFAQEQLRTDNWLTHPDIVDIREIYKEVNNLIDKGSLTKHRNDLGSMGEYTHHKELFVDDDFKIRMLRVYQGAEMGSYLAELYYDINTLLRFVYIKEIAYDHDLGNALLLEYRVYYHTDIRSSLKPHWIVISKNGEIDEIGAGTIDISKPFKYLNERHPYSEFHDRF